jgi:hypothetical protein
VRFRGAPNFEAPNDVGTNNIYDVTLVASDSEFSATQALSVTVTNVNEAPTFVTPAQVTFSENSMENVQLVSASDPDAGATLTYAIGGTDASQFSIDAATGALRFVSSPDFEIPQDAGSNNVYDISVTVTDGLGASTARAMAITVTDQNEAPTSIVWTSGGTIAENSAVNTGIGQLGANDPDASPGLTYSLLGNPGNRFSINATTGEVSLVGSVDFEAAPYHVLTVRTQDSGGLTAEAFLTVVVSNVNEAPTIQSGSSATIAENISTPIYTVSGTDVDANTTLTYALGGVDAARFSINASTGEVRFAPTANFEAPTDAGTDNVYDITVVASDGALSASQAVAITVTNVNEAPLAPAWQSGGSIEENSANGALVGVVQAAQLGDGRVVRGHLVGGHGAGANGVQRGALGLGLAGDGIAQLLQGGGHKGISPR